MRSRGLEGELGSTGTRAEVTDVGLLKRHEVQVLLKAGHKRTEVSRLTGISRSSVQRILAEATTEQFDDTAERLKRRIGRSSIDGRSLP